MTSLHLGDKLAIEIYGPGLLAGINKIVHPTFHRDRQLSMKRKYSSNEFYLVWMQSKNEIKFVFVCLFRFIFQQKAQRFDPYQQIKELQHVHFQLRFLLGVGSILLIYRLIWDISARCDLFRGRQNGSIFTFQGANLFEAIYRHLAKWENLLHILNHMASH